MDFLKLAQERYSCRKFEDKPVEDEKIDALLQAAQLAPSAAKNTRFNRQRKNKGFGRKQMHTIYI